MKKNLLLIFCLFALGLTPPFGGRGSCWLLNTAQAQNIGISTDATAPETGLMLDIKAPSGYPKATDNAAQPFFQIKSFDADASALKLRMGLRTHSAPANRYAFLEFLEAGTPTYLPLALQPSGGNVGIGITTPVSQLHVAKSDITVFDAASATWQQDILPTIKVQNIANNNNASSQIILSNRASTERATRLVNVGSGNGSQLAIITGQAGSEAERMRIDYNGSVGIGTSSPTAKLDVWASSNSNNISNGFPSIRSYNSLATQGDGTTTFNYADIRAIAGNNSVSGGLLAAYNSGGSFQDGVYLRAISNHPLIFNINNTSEKMRIDINGNVGIGTTSPVQELDVFSSNTGMARFLRDLSTDVGLLIDADNDGPELKTIGAHAFDIFTNNLERLRIDASGNVGIGTTAPTDGKLVVYGSSPILSLQNSNTAFGSGSVLRFGHDQVGSTLPEAEIRSVLEDGGGAGLRAGHLAFFTSLTGILSEKMRIRAGGNVGIGTTTPGYKLEVAGGTVAGAGAYVNTSFSGYKKDFKEIDSKEILEKISQLKIQSWVYKPDHVADDPFRHISPFAEDFYDKFHLGKNDTVITTLDMAGVGLVGIQELTQLVKDLSRQINSLQKEIHKYDILMNTLEEKGIIGNSWKEEVSVKTK